MDQATGGGCAATAPPAGASTVTGSSGPDRKRLGAWYTPHELVELVVDAVVTEELVQACADRGRPVRVLDPACGDGRFLAAAAERVRSLGGRCAPTGVDVDPVAAARSRRSVPSADVRCGDALRRDWTAERYDVVIGNPPFLSQLASATTRGGASEHGGGPYADVAVEFLALAAELVADGGRVAFVLPQSVLAARDAAAVRREYDERATMIWSWWTGRREFDAQVLTCALAFEFRTVSRDDAAPRSWASVVTSRQGIPEPPALERSSCGTLGDRARINANFRDEYYGMIPAVGDHLDGPPLVTSGLIDPGVCHWGRRPVRFAKRRFAAPRIDLGALDPRMRRWADDRLVPKVLVANQTRVLEAVCDPVGIWLPGVPVVAVYPDGGAPRLAWEIAALLTSPIASAWCWAYNGGSGLSADAIRVGPRLLADLPWPAGDLGPAVAALTDGDVRRCGDEVVRAYGVTDRVDLTDWWCAALDRLAARS